MKRPNSQDIQNVKTIQNNESISILVPIRDSSESGWLVALAILLLAGGSIAEYSIKGTLYSIPFNVLLLLLILLYWILRYDFLNKRKGDIVVNDAMATVVEQDAKDANLSILKRCFHFDYKGTYSEIKKATYVVLLENGVVWEYPVFIQQANDDCLCYTCIKKHQIADSEHEEFVHPSKTTRWFSGIHFTEKQKLRLLLFSVLNLGGIISAVAFWLLSRWPHLVLLALVVYFALYVLSEWLFSKVKWKAVPILKSIIAAPFLVYYYLGRLAQPFLTIVGTYAIICVLAFLTPASILHLVSNYGLFHLTQETIVFVSMSVGSILSSHFYRFTKWLIHYSPLRNWNVHKYESYREELAIYLVHPSNIIFILYFAYLLYLVISGFLQFQYGSYLFSESIDSAVLKAFLVFIAFTNMMIKMKNVEFDASSLYQRTIALFVPDDKTDGHKSSL